MLIARALRYRRLGRSPGPLRRALPGHTNDTRRSQTGEFRYRSRTAPFKPILRKAMV